MPLLSIRQVTDELGISRVGVERLYRLGRLPIVRIGRRVLVEREELDTFIAARRHGTNGHAVRKPQAVA